MRRITLLIVLLLISGIVVSQDGNDVVIAKRIKLNSTILGEERTIFVSTPASYAGSEKTYPVFYVLNGSAEKVHFFSGLVSGLAARKHCPEMIVVAIAHGSKGWTDMTPTKSDKDWYGEKRNWPSEPGGGDKFLQFMETELFPFVEKNYRTAPYRLYTGHSAGGMAVVHAFLSHNKMFDAYIASSASLWWDDKLFIRTADKKIANMDLKHKQLYFNIGEKESWGKPEDGSSMARILKEKAPEELIWKYEVLKNEDHSSQEPIAIFYGLRFIFNGWGELDYDSLKESGMKAIDNYYQTQAKKYGNWVTPSEADMNGYTYSLVRYGEMDKAIEVGERMCLDHPQSPNAFDSLGEVYLAAGKVELSIENYEKAVELAKESNDSRLTSFIASLEKARGSKKAK